MDPPGGLGEGLTQGADGTVDPGESPTDGAGAFVDFWAPAVKHMDGAKTFKGLNDMDPDKTPKWQVDAFQRTTHDGTASYFVYTPYGNPSASSMSAPATWSYRCTKR